MIESTATRAMTGEQIAHYLVQEPLGRGGMGVVYRATDTKLGRQVALKFLPDDALRTADALDRFVREARSAAALNHPHICTIYEIGEHSGRPFIAMELLEGRTLAEQIAGRPLTIGVSLDLALQVASALEAAHSKGIVHRDIKPANIFTTTGGSAKVLDFGLAKSVAPLADAGAADVTIAGTANLTGAGSTLGTIAYMSPEQARGHDLDGRSDLFSLGLVVYEMVTGRQAFAGETTAVIFDGILNRMPPAPSELNSDVPPELERILAKAIEKDRGERYQTAAEMAADLRSLKRWTDSAGGLAPTTAVGAASGPAWPSVAAQTAARTAVAPPSRGAPWTRALPIAALVLALVGGVAFWQLRGPSGALAESDMILLADFGNATGDPVFDGTLRQALAVKLEESPFLNVLSDQRVRETLGFMSLPPDTPITRAVALEICQRQGNKAIMLGDIASLGSTYVITLAAENCRTGDVLAREQVTAPSKEQVLAAVGEAASAMRGRLGESLASIARTDKPIEQATTPSLEALKAFSLGNEKRNTGSDQEAIPFFRRAVELDPEFALAHAQLGTISANMGETQASVQHRQRAYELRDRVSERERLYILAHYYSGVSREPDRALETYEVWKQTYPRDPVPYINSGTIYSQRGEHERALAAYIQALEIDPARRIAYSNAISKYIELDRMDEARALLDRQIASIGESPETHFRRYEIAARQGDRAEMARHAALLENGPLAANFLGMRSAEMAFYGQLRESRRLSRRHTDLLERQGLTERVASAISGQAAIAAALDEDAAAREYAGAALKLEGGMDARINLAFTMAALGDIAQARRLFRDAKVMDFPDAALADLVNRTFEGLVALVSGRPLETVKTLEIIPVERKHPIVLNALLTRAEAYQHLGRFSEAERDFRALLARRSPAPFSLAYPRAHIGLARTLVATGDTAGARVEYEKFLTLWQDADADAVLLREAQAELAKIGS